MKKICLQIIIAAVLAAAVGCCPCRYSKKYNKPLLDTTWHLVQLYGRDVHFDDDIFQVTFGINGRLTGTGACNKFNAPFEMTDKGALTVGDVVSTRMWCPDSETEQLLYRELRGATHFDIVGDKLLILNNGEIRAIFNALP